MDNKIKIMKIESNAHSFDECTNKGNLYSDIQVFIKY